MDDLTALAAVLAPPDGDADVTRTRSWSALAARGAGSATPAAVALRGRPALVRGTSPLRLAGWAAGREAALAAVRLRPPAPWAIATVHRTGSAPLRPGLLPRLRAALAGGAVVRLEGRAPDGTGSGRTRLDELLEAARVTASGRPRVGSGGGVLVRGVLVGGPAAAAGAPAAAGRPVVVRIRFGPAAPPGQSVAPDGAPCVPQVLAAGATCGLTWVVEQRLPGRPPAHLSGPLVGDVVAFAIRLAGQGPGQDGTDVQRGVQDDLATVAGHLPDLAGGLAALGERVAGALAELPVVAVHGDLWRGNLLAAGGRLTGVVDWDAARPVGPAGVDLLHLVATEERLTGRRGIGAQLLRRPWSGAAFTGVAAGYWKALGGWPPPAALEALGVAWWAGQVAATLRRTPELAADPVWPQREIAAVVQGFGPMREAAR